MNKDSYNEIINGEITYIDIAAKLKQGKSVIIGWTDEEFTHFDILFTLGAYKDCDNQLQRGIKNSDLFVSIIGRSSFGFLMTQEDKDSTYIAEKLNVYGKPTADKLTELINNIIKEILTYW